MKQSRATSFIKSVVSTAVGFGVALGANALVLPWFGYTPTFSENLLLTTIYTVISIARGYALERVYEAMGWRTRMSAFALAVLAERQKQITQYGYTLEHDDERYASGLSADAFEYVDNYCSTTDHATARRHLIRAAALLVAEGERHDRNRKRKAVVIPQADQQPQLSPESKSAA